MVLVLSANAAYPAVFFVCIRLTGQVRECQIAKIDARLVEVEAEENAARDKCDDLNERIKENAESEQLAREKGKGTETA